MSEKITQTAGRNQLGEFAPMFAHLNDDVLFGEAEREEPWRDEGRDRRYYHPCHHVCRLAQRVGGFSAGKRNLER